MTKFIITILLVFVSYYSFAHSGRTNSSGCHNDRKNGGYHCHKSDTSEDRTLASVDYDVTFNKKSKIYHRPACKSAKACTVNCISLKKSEAIEYDARACENCGG